MGYQVLVEPPTTPEPQGSQRMSLGLPPVCSRRRVPTPGRTPRAARPTDPQAPELGHFILLYKELGSCLLVPPRASHKTFSSSILLNGG